LAFDGRRRQRLGGAFPIFSASRPRFIVVTVIVLSWGVTGIAKVTDCEPVSPRPGIAAWDALKPNHCIGADEDIGMPAAVSDLDRASGC
jgi:hypothetical protein